MQWLFTTRSVHLLYIPLSLRFPGFNELPVFAWLLISILRLSETDLTIYIVIQVALFEINAYKIQRDFFKKNAPKFRGVS